MDVILSDLGGLHCPSGKADTCSFLPSFPVLCLGFKNFLLREARDAVLTLDFSFCP